MHARRGFSLAAVATVALAAAGGTAAWAKGGDQEKNVRVAATYNVTVPADGVTVKSVFWQVGQVQFQASCGAAMFPEDPVAPVHVGGGGGVKNTGPDRVRVMSGTGEEEGWLEPGQETDLGPGGPGEMVNETFPEGQGMMDPIAVLDQDGISATGSWAWSFWADPATGTGHCVFTLQAEG